MTLPTMEVRPLRHRSPARMSVAEFCELWPRVRVVYSRYPHAFLRGCGRETLTWWVRRAGLNLSPAQLYACLFQALDYGLVQQRQSLCGYRIWDMGVP